jgi:hypothetical protein
MSKPFPHLLRVARAAAWAAAVVSAGAVAAADAVPSRTPPTATTQPASVPTYRERYTVLSDRNIFVKERYKIVPESDGRRSEQGPRDIRVARPLEAGYVLTGVVLEEGLFRAYVEDSNASRILRLTSGDSVANGHIGTIAIDAVAYVANGQTKTIPIGNDLTGTPISFSTTQSGGSWGYGSGGYGSGGSGRGGTTGPSTGSSVGSTTSGPPPAPLPDPNNPNLSLEERMRLRRAQELRK